MILKINFFDWYMLRENMFEAARPIWDTFVNVYGLHSVLDASRCQLPHYRWRDGISFGRIVTGLVGGLWLDHLWKDRKPAQGVS